jgi:hypothetical protein
MSRRVAQHQTVFALSDEARTLVLSKQGVQVTRIGLHLNGGSVNTVRW